jgi:serine/threonine protein kinase
MAEKSPDETYGSASARYAALWDRQEAMSDPKVFLASHPGATARDVADILLVDQAGRWRRGCGRPVEEYLSVFPPVALDPELRLDLVYGEYRARAGSGELPDLDMIASRFPELRAELLRQIEVGQWLGDTGREAWSNNSAGSAAQETTINRSELAQTVETFATLPFADFQLQGAIGAGAMGEVYRAFQKSLRRWVAIKVLKQAAGRHPHGVDRFLREARAIASLRHSNIVTIYGIGRTPQGGHFLAMELIEGVSLNDRLRDGPLSPSEASHIVADVADGINHANARGVIHRDLKPSNVLIEKDGRIVITDFGLAKHHELGEGTLSSSGDIVGTPQYMAPEQVDSRWGEVGPRTDVYGLGALLYALLVGRPPVQGNTVIEVLTGLGSGRLPIAPRTIRADIPLAIEKICLKCLANAQANRYSSAYEVAEALRRESQRQQEPDESASHSRPIVRRSLRWVNGPRRTWVYGTVAMIVLGLSLGLVLWRRGGVVGDGAASGSRVASGDKSVASTDAWHGVGAAWSIDLYRQGQSKDRLRLTEAGGFVRNGDKLHIRVDLTEPLHAYLFWIGSEGSVEPLHPENSEPDEVTRSITVPSLKHSGLPVRGPAGAEICLLLLRQSPLPGSDKIALIARLRPPKSILSLSLGKLLVDAKSATCSEAGGQRTTQDTADAAMALEKLGFDTGSRSVGPAEPLDGLPAPEAMSAWGRQAAQGYGETRYVVLPHVAH